VLGLDVSAWQTDITTAEWATLKRPTNQQVGGIFGDGLDFVFIRSSRGGTTGYYDQNNSDNSPPTNTLSQRYDDPYYIRNITRATAAGLLAGTYHFSRPDIVAGTLNANGVANSGADEADHFIQMAGPWMRPGYLLPVHDFEAGDGARTDQQLTQFCLDFSNRIYQVMGIRPAIYTSGNYAGILANSGPLLPQVVPAYPTLWSARWPAGSGNEYFGDVQNENPKDTYTPIYGPWDDSGVTHPWVFWQYGSGGRLNGNNGGASNTDVNVAHGNIEFVKDQMVPALWMQSTSGNWETLANWNSGLTPVAPVQGTGQVARVGAMTLPGARLPGQADPNNAANGTNVTGADDTVNLNRPNENITVTLSQGTYNLRRLNLNETLNVTGGTLDARLTGWVSTGGTLSLSGGSVTFTQAYVNNGGVLNFSGNGVLNVGTLFLSQNPTFTGASGTGQIMGKVGVANPVVDLMGGTRTFTVGDGSASTDMRVWIPLTNGNFTKAGAGTLELTGNNSAFAGTLQVDDGILRLTNANQIGTTGVRTTQASTTVGGTIRIDGNGLNLGQGVNQQLVLAGLGAGGGLGALENITGNNTWSGAVVLNGANNNQGQLGLNQISAATGTTLTLSGVIQNGAGTSWAKIGAGDVVLTGNSPNTYTNLTRTFGGRLIVEKDAALGAAGSAADATGNTFMLPGVNSGIAFRARSGQTGLDYNAAEWIFTEGGGINGAQVDNLGGTNTFAGHLGFGGASVNGRRSSSIGVSAGSLEVEGGLYARFYSNLADPAAAEADTRRDIAKRGAGTLILSGDSGPAPTNASARSLVDSSFTVEAGTVELKGAGANVAGVSAWNVNAGAVLRLNSNSANPTVAGAVSGPGTMTKTGAGRVTLGGAVNSFAGALAVNQGVLAVGLNGGNSRVANVNGLTIGSNANLDLTDNDLVVRGTSPATVEQLVAAGYNGGAWNGTTAIISSTAAANQWIYTLGVADNARLNLLSFSGQTLTGTEALVKYTIVGDADLSGAVNAADFARFRAGFANEMPDAWTFGDFNYSGVVDAADWNLFMFGFHNQPGSSLTTDFASQMITFAVDNGLDFTLVPEPTNLALLALGAGALMRRRRR
jgi:autotransporter-associated beta strand protein